MERARRAWGVWDEACARGDPPAKILAEAADELLVELATTGDPTRRKYELNLVMVELANRIQRLRQEIREVRMLAETHLAGTRSRMERGERLIAVAAPIMPARLRDAAHELVEETRASLDTVREALAKLESDAFAHAREPK